MTRVVLQLQKIVGGFETRGSFYCNCVLSSMTFSQNSPKQDMTSSSRFMHLEQMTLAGVACDGVKDRDYG